jgi:hypothetical protein
MTSILSVIQWEFAFPTLTLVSSLVNLLKSITPDTVYLHFNHFQCVADVYK